MKECLLCQQNIESIPKFFDIFLLRKEEKLICLSCERKFTKLAERHCQSCCKELDDDKKVCQDCKNWLAIGHEVNHQALYKYDESMKEYFSTYKFMGHYNLRGVFASDLKKMLKQYRGFTLVPIPLAGKRLFERGFNQVSSILDYAGIKYEDYLVKHDTKKQSSLSRFERLNHENPFELLAEVKDDKICIIDDIYTSGATL
jgi:Predicted amidophosphoribosyltransferases